MEAFRQANLRTSKLVEGLRRDETLTEGAVAASVVEACPAGSILMLGNSMPVRDVDTWALARHDELCVVHQRGASGIDGLVSGAAGVSAATRRTVTLLLGDLSLLHDIGGLALARRAVCPLVIVVVQNAGGRIFEHLPVGRAADSDHFDKYFTMPEPIEIEAAARAFSVRFSRATNPSELSSALEAAWKTPSATLVEAIVPPSDGVARLARLRATLAAAFSDAPPFPETGAA